MNEVSTIGVDLAKSVFQLHGVDDAGKPVLRRQLRRSQMLEVFQNLPACLVGMEGRQGCATGLSNRWRRQRTLLGAGVDEARARGAADAAKRREGLCEARELQVTVAPVGPRKHRK